jgi:adenine-specific DNA-methyltransferase
MPPLEGIEGPESFVPILRGGAATFVRPTQWYVDWSVQAVAEYRRAGKNTARFQNSQFYFREGIGVPMVSSARLTAALLEGRLFDQGIVGVFAKDDRMLHFLLGFLNTQLATVLLRQINPTANNSANYLKRLPVVSPSTRELREANVLVATAIFEARESQSVSVDTLTKIESFYRAMWCHGAPE